MKNDSFVKKLKAYSVISGVVIASASSANAQVDYGDVVPDDTLFIDGPGYNLNLGGTSFILSGWYSQSENRNYWRADIPFGDEGYVLMEESNPYLIRAMNEGDSICPSGSMWAGGYSVGYFLIFNSTYQIGSWTPGTTDAFMGLRKGDSNVGWIRLDVAPDGSYLIIKDWAYSTQPGDCIVAGEGIPLGFDNIKQLNLQIYPNPTSSKILLLGLNENFNDLEVSIHDLSGRKIFSKKISSSQNEIDVSSFPNGIYLLELKNENEIITRKFEVKK